MAGWWDVLATVKMVLNCCLIVFQVGPHLWRSQASRLWLKFNQALKFLHVRIPFPISISISIIFNGRSNFWLLLLLLLPPLSAENSWSHVRLCPLWSQWVVGHPLLLSAPNPSDSLHLCEWSRNELCVRSGATVAKDCDLLLQHPALLYFSFSFFFLVVVGLAASLSFFVAWQQAVTDSRSWSLFLCGALM